MAVYTEARKRLDAMMPALKEALKNDISASPTERKSSQFEGTSALPPTPRAALTAADLSRRMAQYAVAASKARDDEADQTEAMDRLNEADARLAAAQTFAMDAKKQAQLRVLDLAAALKQAAKEPDRSRVAALQAEYIAAVSGYKQLQGIKPPKGTPHEYYLPGPPGFGFETASAK